MARASNVPPPPETMDPYAAAQLAVERCDGTLFMERMIRVDLASKNANGVKGPGDQGGLLDGNPKLSVFVGNLDFGCKEEDLRAFFEGIVSSERGPPVEDASDDEDENKKLKTWVTRVRIIRDKETQLGKGFGYVQFAVRIFLSVLYIYQIHSLMSDFAQDRACVDEILAMEETKLKFAKRKLRVQRCKTIPSLSSGARLVTRSDSKLPVSLRSRAPTVAVPIPPIPKGDPSLGGKLAHLPKDERKQMKASDADRVARRLAKKKARNALAKQGVKPQVKDRDRVRKTMDMKKVSVPQRNKGRVRSEKSLAKRNAKK